jgi:hypothetical protein
MTPRWGGDRSRRRGVAVLAAMPGCPQFGEELFFALDAGLYTMRCIDIRNA